MRCIFHSFRSCSVWNNNKTQQIAKGLHVSMDIFPDSQVHGANMGPIWGRQDPGGPHVGPMNIAIWDCMYWFPKSPVIPCGPTCILCGHENNCSCQIDNHSLLLAIQTGLLYTYLWNVQVVSTCLSLLRNMIMAFLTKWSFPNALCRSEMGMRCC